jgi:hypothetical protein
MSGHGPEPCEECGITHTPAWWHYEADGSPRIDINEPEIRRVVFAGFDSTGQPLYSDAPYEGEGESPS